MVRYCLAILTKRTNRPDNGVLRLMGSAAPEPRKEAHDESVIGVGAGGQVRPMLAGDAIENGLGARRGLRRTPRGSDRADHRGDALARRHAHDAWTRRTLPAPLRSLLLRSRPPAFGAGDTRSSRWISNRLLFRHLRRLERALKERVRQGDVLRRGELRPAVARAGDNL